MKFFFKPYIIIFIILLSFSYSFQQSFIKSNGINFEKELIDDISDKYNNDKLIAMGLSALFPGAGHFYLGNNDVGAIYTWVELSGWMIRENYNNKIERSSEVYKEYATNHWSLAKWIKSYFNPKDSRIIMVTNDTEDDDYIYQNIFTDYPICNGKEACVINPDEEVYASFVIDGEFSKPWQHSHKIEFSYSSNGYSGIQSTSDNNFKEIYKDICNTDEYLNYICFNENGHIASIDDIEEILNNEDLVYSHHLYEGISKYNMYFAGWDDSNEGYMQQVGSGYNVVYSPHKLFYENTLRSNHKKNNDSANNVLSAILINHAVSVLDIILRNTNISVSTESNYNAVNQFGINKINLSIGLN